MLTLYAGLRGAACIGLAVLVPACLPSNADAAREPTLSIQSLLISAIERGHAHGVLIGPAADAMAAQFASRLPIQVDVTVVAALASPDCKRLRVETRQEQVVEHERPTVPGRSARPLPAKPMLLQYDISFCRDGTLAPRARAAVPAGRGPSKPAALP